jgi:hypothetical protein
MQVCFCRNTDAGVNRQWTTQKKGLTQRKYLEKELNDDPPPHFVSLPPGDVAYDFIASPSCR